MEAAKRIARAKLAEHTERYDDMAALMKTVIENKENIQDPQTRNLLSVAYKNVVGTKRSAWRILSSLEAKESKEEQRELIKEYKSKIEEDLRSVCKEVIVRCNVCTVTRTPDIACEVALVAQGTYY